MSSTRLPLRNGVHLCGVTSGRRRRWHVTRAETLLGRKLTDEERVAAGDRGIYHPRDQRRYQGIGITDDRGLTYCVGCWWCEGPWTAVHDLYLGKREG